MGGIMGRTGGDKTRQRILEVAEELFSKNGFHATSVSQITKKALVNKAALYYHFKDKNDLILSLFQMILDDFSETEILKAVPVNDWDSNNVKRAIRQEISFLEKRKDIFAIMLMESLKSEDGDRSLFRCVELAMKRSPGMPSSTGGLVHEFFTGFVPLLAFVVLKDKWCDYFQQDKEHVLVQFIKSFIASHIETHPENPKNQTN
jgi:AcrR family transcriptional regulator